jgi:uncharacterized membrane protein
VEKVGGEGVGARFRWTYKMAGFTLEGESVALEFIPNERIVTKSKSGIVSTWTWVFGAENGGTRIDLTVDYEVPVPVLGKLAEALVVRQNERELDKGLATIKGRFENEGQQPGSAGAPVQHYGP